MYEKFLVFLRILLCDELYETCFKLAKKSLDFKILSIGAIYTFHNARKDHELRKTNTRNLYFVLSY